MAGKQYQGGPFLRLNEKDRSRVLAAATIKVTESELLATRRLREAAATRGSRSGVATRRWCLSCKSHGRKEDMGLRAQRILQCERHG